MKAHFSQWGTVTDVYFPKNKHTFRRRPFCFITFATLEAAQRALAESPMNICGALLAAGKDGSARRRRLPPAVCPSWRRLGGAAAGWYCKWGRAAADAGRSPWSGAVPAVDCGRRAGSLS